MVKKTKSASEKTKRLILLDTHAIIHRAYHALPDFASSKGEPTGALYGLSTMLMKIVTDLKPDYIVATYDLAGKTFRHIAYDAYKAGRAKTDDALIAQIKASRNIFEAFNIPMYDAPGFEADDMLGTIVEQLAKDTTVEVVIASGDMDTLQLVTGTKVQVFTLKKGITDTILYDEEAVKTRFGFAPTLLPDYKGLRGDPSDNIIGIKGVGEKTATTLIQEFGTIEDIYKALKKSPKKFTEVGITERMIALLQEGEEEALFSKTLATIRKDAPITFLLPEKKFRENIDIEKIETLFREYEFRSLVPRVKALFGGVVEEKEQAIVVAQEANVDPVELEKAKIALWLLNSEINNATYEEILTYGEANTFPEAQQKLVEKINASGLGYVYEHIELAILDTVKSMTVQGVMIDKTYLKKLSDEYHKELNAKEKAIWRYAGREFNINSPKQLGEILFDELKIQEGQGMRLKKTTGGARSTRESELVKFRGLHPIIEHILEHRELQKLLSTYIDTIPLLLADDGKLHATFTQTGSTTGRFSSQNPNLQNIPIRTELGKKIRNAFIASPGHVLVSFDYSQIELRIAALLSQDDYFIKVFQEGKDVHAAVAAKVFSVSEDKVDYEMRRRAKIINFGILYGMGVNALKENLGTDRKTAQEFFNNYFLQFPKIEGYLKSIEQFAYAHGYTETLFGRRRYFPGLKSKLPFIRAMAERMAINAPIQGTAADVIKIAIRDVALRLKEEKLDDNVHLILQVHDELIYEVAETHRETAQILIEKVMQETIGKDFIQGKKAVPLEVHTAYAKNWGEMK